MDKGTPVNRQLVIVLKNGSLVIDWGEGVCQDVYNGSFLDIEEKMVSHHVLDQELDWLIKVGQVASYDANTVKFINLPVRPQPTID